MVGQPGFGQNGNLVPVSIAAASTVGAPGLGQVHILTASGVTSAPVVGTPSSSPIANLEPLSISSTATVSNPILSQLVALMATSVAAAAAVEQPSLAQIHVLLAQEIAASATVGTPLPAGALDPIGIIATPTVGHPALSVEVAPAIAALKAALDAGAWDVTGVCPLIDDNGYGTIAYQLSSPTVSFVAVRELSDSSDTLCLYVGHFAYQTPDPGLIAQLEALAGPALAAAEAELIAQIA
jgi:hypothetical protein